VTDINPNVPDTDDGLFEAASETFPSKFDLKNRLVVIYPDGETGQRLGENGKPYTWYSTTTVVLDDGPDGWQERVVGEGGEMQANLVPSVADEGPQVLKRFQWSAGGITARLAPRLPKADGKPGSQVGRINSRPNTKKGMAPSWSISAPTEADMATAREYADVCRAARDEITKANQAKVDADSF
jgi:hypothetical protein